MDQVVDLEALEARLPELAPQYRAASPFPHLVLDGIVAPEVLEHAEAELRAIPDTAWTNYLHLNERKFAHARPAEWGPNLRGLAEAFSSAAFVAYLGRLTGIEGLEPDPAMDGGGLHRSFRGGFLNVHADFSVHHDDRDLQRRVNLLLYLNSRWDPAWGGDLELWDPDMRGCVRRIEPRGNRVLLFTTSERSYHGHPDALRCPEGVARQSLALYYFTRQPGGRARSTDYRARPGDGARAVGIFLDKQALRAYDAVKRRLRVSDGAASRSLGLFGRVRRGR